MGGILPGMAVNAIRYNEITPALRKTKKEAEDYLADYVRNAMTRDENFPNPDGDPLSEVNLDYLYRTYNGPPSAYFQTSDARTSGAISIGNIVNVVKDLANWTLADAEAFTTHYRNSNREIYLANQGSSAGGGGSVNTQPDLIVGSSWAAPDADVDTFKIIHPINAGFLPATRPGKDGKIVPHPERYSTFRIMDIDGNTIYATTNIMVQAVVDARQETFMPSGSSDGSSGTFGEEGPRRVQVSAVLLNADNFDWKRKWERVYDQMARGSVLSKKEWRFYFLYMAEIYGGYPIAQTISTTAQGDQTPTLSFQMHVTNHLALPKLKTINEAEGVYSYGGETMSQLLEDMQKLGLLESMSEYFTEPPGPGESEEEYG